MSHILVCENHLSHISGVLHEAFVQTALLHGCKSRTLPKPMIELLNGFHHLVVHHINGKQPFLQGDSVCPSIEEAMQEAGLFTTAPISLMMWQHGPSMIFAPPNLECLVHLIDHGGGKDQGTTRVACNFCNDGA